MVGGGGKARANANTPTGWPDDPPFYLSVHPSGCPTSCSIFARPHSHLSRPPNPPQTIARCAAPTAQFPPWLTRRNPHSCIHRPAGRGHLVAQAPLTNRPRGTIPSCSRIRRGRRDWLDWACAVGRRAPSRPHTASSLRRGRKKGNFSAA